MAAAATINHTSARSVLKPAFVLMCGRILAFTATFFIPVILARIFDQAQFGTYKQIFLVFSTIFLIAQLGMSQSLYYFLPRAPRQAGRYAANAICVLAVAGLLCFGGLTAASSTVARWLSNEQLTAYLPWMGVYLFLMMPSTALEIVMISRGRYSAGSAVYAGSDLIRAAALILPVVIFGGLKALVAGAVVVGGLRLAAMLFYFGKEFGDGFRPGLPLLREQFGYTAPFGIAVLVETLQASLPQYAVAHWFEPATFAIFAVGCLQIPLVDFAASPTSDVMMVKMQESRAEGDMCAILDIWHDTTWKLALLFFPLAGMMMVNSQEIIRLLFTDRYLASAPIFLVWSAMILLAVLQVDGVLRVFAQTRLLLGFNAMRLAIIGVSLPLLLSKFHLVGAAIAVVLATAAFKVAALVRIRALLAISISQLLPWRRLAALGGAVSASAIAALAVKAVWTPQLLPLLLTTGTIMAAIYGLLVWHLDLLQADEKLALLRYARKLRRR